MMEGDTASILVKAYKAVHGERGENYGPPHIDFERSAKMWSAVLGHEVSGAEVALCMICVKISRCVHKLEQMNLMKGDDSVIDIAGYAEALDMTLSDEESLLKGLTLKE